MNNEMIDEMYIYSDFLHDCALHQAGCGAILVGESIVKQGDPEAGVKALLA